MTDPAIVPQVEPQVAGPAMMPQVAGPAMMPQVASPAMVQQVADPAVAPLCVGLVEKPISLTTEK